MAYALQSMLRIRGMREDRAQTELATARYALGVAERELAARRERRMDYDKTKESRRDRVYEAVIGKVVSRQEVELAREAVTQIDEQALLLRRDEDAADQERQQRESFARVAQLAYFAAAKDRTKITEHRKLWEEEDRRQREALADAEMEEFAGRKLVAEDDDTFD